MAEDQKQPLLVNHGDAAESPIHNKCPGCRVAYLRHENAPVPFKLLFPLGFVIFTNWLPFAAAPPFLYFMIQDFHVASREEDVGFYAGWIASACMIGQITSGVVWGVIADRLGRKPVMLCSLLSIIVFYTLFSLSSNFWMALVMQFLLGAFNGMFGTVKAYASEICNEWHQAISMSLIGITKGISLIIAPAIGGYLSQPVTKYPHIFKAEGLFARFPYLLQALVVLAFVLIAMIVCFYLPETLHRGHGPLSDGEDTAIAARNAKEDGKVQDLIRNWSFISPTFIYCFWSLQDMATAEIFSLWTVSKRSYGGLGLTSSDTGGLFSVAGLAMFVYQIVLFPCFERWLGPILITRISALLILPILMAYPFFSKLHGITLWGLLLTGSIGYVVLDQSALTGIYILINNSVKQAQRGAANGFALSVVSLFNAIAPAGGGALFAWCQTRQNTWFLPGNYLVFFILNVFVLLVVLMTFNRFLPSSLSKPMLE